MGRSYDEVMKSLPKKRRARIEKRGDEIINEHVTLQALRKAHELTQVKMAQKLNVKQESISRLEKRSDMLLSTLRGYLEAMGGELDITVRFKNGEPVALSGLGKV